MKWLFKLVCLLKVLIINIKGVVFIFFNIFLLIILRVGLLIKLIFIFSSFRCFNVLREWYNVLLKLII